MKHFFKKALAFTLSALLIFTIIPTNVFANEFSYSQIIKPEYDDTRGFSDDLAAVMKNDKWGYIDTTGKTIIQFKYDIAYSFSENKALVGTIGTQKDEYGEYTVINWGFVDRAGNYVPLTRADKSQFNTYYEAEYFDVTETTQFLYNGILVMHDGDSSYAFGPDGKELLTSMGEYAPLYAPTEGIATVYLPASSFFRYVDQKTGKLLFEDKEFVAVRPFNQGLAFAGFYDENLGEGYWNIINTSGKIVNNKRFSNFFVKNIYSEYKVFNDYSLASVCDTDEKWGAIDITGKTVIPFKYESLRPFIEGVASFSKDGKYGFIDIYGNEVIAPQFDDVSGFYNGLAVARIGNTAYCIDKTGKKVEGTDKLPIDSYFAVNGTDEDGNDRYVIRTPGKYVIINENGKYGFGKVTFIPSLPTAAEMDSWALKEVTLAIENNLVPSNLQNMYRTDTTRVDFAALVVRAIEEIAGKDINAVIKEKTGETLYQLISKYPFVDTTDKNVIAAQALGIINGKGEGKFAPYDTITRQDAAALLMRTAKFLGKESTTESKTFNDSKNIANYAKEAVNFVSGLGIMNGKENNNFAPNDSYNREQAYITIYRLFNVLITK